MATAAVSKPSEAMKTEQQEPAIPLISPSAPAPRARVPFKCIPYSSHTRHLDPSVVSAVRPTGGNELRKFIMKKQPPRDSQPGSCNTSDPNSAPLSPDQFPADSIKPHLKGNAPRKSPLKGGRGRPPTITGAPGYAHPQAKLDPSICSMCQQAKAIHRGNNNNLCERCNKVYPGCRRIGMKHEDVTRMLSMIPNADQLDERTLSAQVKEKYRTLQLRATPDMHAQHAYAQPQAGRGGLYRAGPMMPHPGREGRGGMQVPVGAQQPHMHAPDGPGPGMSGRPKPRDEKMRKTAMFAFSTEITFGRPQLSPQQLIQSQQKPHDALTRGSVGQMVEERCVLADPPMCCTGLCC